MNARVVERIGESKGFVQFWWRFDLPDPFVPIEQTFDCHQIRWVITYAYDSKGKKCLFVGPDSTLLKSTRLIAFIKYGDNKIVVFHEYVKKDGGFKQFTYGGQLSHINHSTIVEFYLASPRKTVYDMLKKLLSTDPTKDRRFMFEHDMFDWFSVFYNEYDSIEEFKQYCDNVRHEVVQRKRQQEAILQKQKEDARLAEFSVLKDESDKIIGKCAICQIRNPTRVLLPCGHLCLCLECFEISKCVTCPLCRKQIEESVRCFY